MHRTMLVSYLDNISTDKDLTKYQITDIPIHKNRAENDHNGIPTETSLTKYHYLSIPIELFRPSITILYYTDLTKKYFICFLIDINHCICH